MSFTFTEAVLHSPGQHRSKPELVLRFRYSTVKLVMTYEEWQKLVKDVEAAVLAMKRNGIHTS